MDVLSWPPNLHTHLQQGPSSVPQQPLPREDIHKDSENAPELKTQQGAAL